MVRIGLTGGIGSGKSTVARELASLGAVVVDADDIARQVLAPGSPGLAAVADRFGDTVVAADGSLDRAALAAIVFGDEAARRDLEGITHPRIAERTLQCFAAAGPDAVVVHDVPLLVEKDMGSGYHLVLVVDAPVEERVRRLVERRGMSEADVRARMAHQASDDRRRQVADVVIDNADGEERLRDDVGRLWRTRIEPFAENLRAGRSVSRPETPVLVDYDPAWPAAAERIIGRLCAALGERAPEIEHIGSTAVPGMPGKDVVDVQVGVARLADADDPAFVAALAEAGFPRVDDYRMDHPTSAMPDPEMWVKRFHGSCDPGRIAHIHVRELESPGWQYALLFRDWLRAVPGAAQEYVGVKRELADEHGTTTGYASAKEPWFDEIWPQMQAWARRTGWHD